MNCPTTHCSIILRFYHQAGVYLGVPSLQKCESTVVNLSKMIYSIS